MDNELFDYECTYCGFKAKTHYEICMHECDGKMTQRAAVSFGREIGVGVAVSV